MNRRSPDWLGQSVKSWMSMLSNLDKLDEQGFVTGPWDGPPQQILDVATGAR